MHPRLVADKFPHHLAGVDISQAQDGIVLMAGEEESTVRQQGQSGPGELQLQDTVKLSAGFEIIGNYRPAGCKGAAAVAGKGHAIEPVAADRAPHAAELDKDLLADLLDEPLGPPPRFQVHILPGRLHLLPRRPALARTMSSL